MALKVNERCVCWFTFERFINSGGRWCGLRGDLIPTFEAFFRARDVELARTYQQIREGTTPATDDTLLDRSRNIKKDTPMESRTYSSQDDESIYMLPSL